MSSITQAQIDAILKESTFEYEKMGEKTTVLLCRLPNGFELVESSACVDPANYSSIQGIEICKKRIAQKLWFLEGYRLQCELHWPLESGQMRVDGQADRTKDLAYVLGRRLEGLMKTFDIGWGDAFALVTAIAHEKIADQLRGVDAA